MKCVRCEIARAKVRAIFYYNMGLSPEALAVDLSGRYEGEYFVRRNEHGAAVYRRNDNPIAPAIEIWFF